MKLFGRLVVFINPTYFALVLSQLDPCSLGLTPSPNVEAVRSCSSQRPLRRMLTDRPLAHSRMQLSSPSCTPAAKQTICFYSLIVNKSHKKQKQQHVSLLDFCHQFLLKTETFKTPQILNMISDLN